MEIVGRIIQVLPELNGVAKATGRAWKKREYVLETTDNFPRKVHFDFFGERADQFPLSVGQNVRLFFDIESREYNGRWYTSIRGIRAEDADGGQTPTYPQQMQQPPFGQPMAPPAVAQPPMQQPPFPQAPEAAGPNDDLPF